MQAASLSVPNEYVTGTPGDGVSGDGGDGGGGDIGGGGGDDENGGGDGGDEISESERPSTLGEASSALSLRWKTMLGLDTPVARLWPSVEAAAARVHATRRSRRENAGMIENSPAIRPKRAVLHKRRFIPGKRRKM